MVKGMMFWIGMAVISLLLSSAKDNDVYYHQVIEDGLYGFIDSTGKILIKPAFRSASLFSEEVAAVRTEGYFGFIDKTGSFVIPPQFDYAEDFHYGLALVYKNGESFFIDHSGKEAFPTDFEAMSSFRHGISIVKTKGNLYGLINTKGILLADTIYSDIDYFKNGYAVVSTNPRSYQAEWSVLDTLGRLIVPLGKYRDIRPYTNGYFKVEIPAEPWDTIDGYTSKTGFIDTGGKLLFAQGGKNFLLFEDEVHCGLVKVYDDDTYGYVDMNGKMVIKTKYDYAENFSCDRAFVRNDNWEYSLIDTKGKVIANKAYSDVLQSGFVNGLAFVEKNGKWGLIDTNGIFLIAPQFEGIAEVGLVNEYFFYKIPKPTADDPYAELYGVAHISGKILTEPIMQYIYEGFNHGLLLGMIDGKETYLDKKGKVVWQENDEKNTKLKNLNIDFMNRGYFYAYAEHRAGDICGYGTSRNEPVSMSDTDLFPPNALSLLVKTGNTIPVTSILTAYRFTSLILHQMKYYSVHRIAGYI